MKTLYRTNKYFTIIGIGTSLTIWGAIIALPILGFTQIVMSIYLFKYKSKLTKKIKTFFYSYLFITITLVIAFKLISIFTNLETVVLLLYWILVSSFLALLHLYITYLSK